MIFCCIKVELISRLNKPFQTTHIQGHAACGLDEDSTQHAELHIRMCVCVCVCMHIYVRARLQNTIFSVSNLNTLVSSNSYRCHTYTHALTTSCSVQQQAG